MGELAKRWEESHSKYFARARRMPSCSTHPVGPNSFSGELRNDDFPSRGHVRRRFRRTWAHGPCCVMCCASRCEVRKSSAVRSRETDSLHRPQPGRLGPPPPQLAKGDIQGQSDATSPLRPHNRKHTCWVRPAHRAETQ